VISPLLQKRRRGKGFSLGELRAVGLDSETARKIGLPIDKRRKSVHEENIKALKDFLNKVSNQK